MNRVATNMSSLTGFLRDYRLGRNCASSMHTIRRDESRRYKHVIPDGIVAGLRASGTTGLDETALLLCIQFDAMNRVATNMSSLTGLLPLLNEMKNLPF
jgi:hypothetical protein